MENFVIYNPLVSVTKSVGFKFRPNSLNGPNNENKCSINKYDFSKFSLFLFSLFWFVFYSNDKLYKCAKLLHIISKGKVKASKD